MKTIAQIFILLLFVNTTISCSSSAKGEGNNDETSVSDKIEVYYFHNTRRCMTCNAVEKVTKDALKEYFPEKMKNGEIIFKSLNVEKEDNKALANKLNVSGQTLLFVFGESQVNLTSKAFMYAKNTPEKLKIEVKKTVESFSKK